MPSLVERIQSLATRIAAEVKAARLMAQPACVSLVIDGGGAAIGTGVVADIEIPFGCVVTGWSLLADQAGSIVVDVWRASHAGAPPVSGDSITASARPALASALKAQSSTLTGWTTAISAGDVLRVDVVSAATIRRATLTLRLRRT